MLLPTLSAHQWLLFALGVLALRLVYWIATSPYFWVWVRIVFAYRGKNYGKFIDEHRQLFLEGQRQGNHSKCTSHFYDLMAELIEAYYGPSFHFAPPQYKGQSNDDALRDFHANICKWTQLAPGKTALDLGCGVGGLLRDLGRMSGAKITGITLSDEEVRIGNELCQRQGVSEICKLVQGNMQNLPFPDQSFDVVYGCYTFKYLTEAELQRALREVNRVLKPGGLLFVYCLMKSDKFDEKNKRHRDLFAGFEYSCGMPPLHYTKGMIRDCEAAQMRLLSRFNTSHDDLQWYGTFANSKVICFLLSSKLIRALMHVAEWIFILPKRFTEFMGIFLANNVLSLVEAGSNGTMDGSEVLIFQKN